jgi:hypothetical protein
MSSWSDDDLSAIARPRGTFEPGGDEVASVIDAAYQEKYKGSSAVPIMQVAGPTSATVRISPRWNTSSSIPAESQASQSWQPSFSSSRSKLIFEVEHLRNDLPGFVGSTFGLEQFGHRGLPASIDLGASHTLLSGSKIVRFRVTDEQAVIAQEE